MLSLQCHTWSSDSLTAPLIWRRHFWHLVHWIHWSVATVDKIFEAPACHDVDGMSSTVVIVVTAIDQQLTAPELLLPESLFRDLGLRPGHLVQLTTPARASFPCHARTLVHGDGPVFSYLAALALGVTIGDAVTLLLPQLDPPPAATLVHLVQLELKDGQLSAASSSSNSGSALGIALKGLMRSHLVSPMRLIGHSWRNLPQTLLVQHCEPEVSTVGPSTTIQLVELEDETTLGQRRGRTAVPAVADWLCDVQQTCAG